jgi:hypothetical protein
MPAPTRELRHAKALGCVSVHLSITKAEIGMNGNLRAQAALGLHAEGSYARSYSKEIISVPLPEAGVKVCRAFSLSTNYVLSDDHL